MQLTGPEKTVILAQDTFMTTLVLTITTGLAARGNCSVARMAHPTTLFECLLAATAVVGAIATVMKGGCRPAGTSAAL